MPIVDERNADRWNSVEGHACGNRRLWAGGALDDYATGKTLLHPGNPGLDCR